MPKHTVSTIVYCTERVRCKSKKLFVAITLGKPDSCSVAFALSSVLCSGLLSGTRIVVSFRLTLGGFDVQYWWRE